MSGFIGRQLCSTKDVNMSDCIIILGPIILPYKAINGYSELFNPKFTFVDSEMSTS